MECPLCSLPNEEYNGEDVQEDADAAHRHGQHPLDQVAKYLNIYIKRGFLTPLRRTDNKISKQWML